MRVVVAEDSVLLREGLARLLREAGFADITFLRVGRVPPLAKSMIAIARRPTEGTKG